MLIYLWTSFILHVLASGIYMAHLGGKYPRIETKTKGSDFIMLLLCIGWAIWSFTLIV